MGESEEVSSLIGEIYDAALDPALWVNVIARAAGFVQGPAGALFSKDAVSKTGNVVYHFGIDPHFERLYFDKYIKLDPLTIGHFFAEIGEPVAVGDLMPYEEFVESRAYTEWGRPQGLVDVLNVALDKTVTSAAMFCIFRHERDGRVDDEMRRRMRLIVPHMRRSVMIGRVISLKAADAASLSDTLDGMSSATLLVDAEARIVHANLNGHVMLTAGDVLSATNGRLAAFDSQANLALREVCVAAGNGDIAIGIKGIDVLLMSRRGERYVAHVLPLTSGARRRAGVRYAADAAIFVHKAELATPSAPEVIAKSFGLTPTELRVLLAIVEVGGIAETAEALGITANTVKTHLQRLYAKTGADNHAQLVRLVAGFTGPLAG